MTSSRIFVLLCAAAVALLAALGAAVWAAGHPVNAITLGGALVAYVIWTVIAAKLSDWYADRGMDMPPCMHAYADQLVHGELPQDQAVPVHAASLCAPCKSSTSCPRLAPGYRPPARHVLPSFGYRVALAVSRAGVAARRLRHGLEG